MKVECSELVFILDRLCILHRNLIGLLNEEYDHMTKVDIDALLEAAHSKEVILGDIWSLEQQRQRKVAELAQAFSLDITISLSKLIEALPNENAEKLKTIRTALNLLISQARELNARNMLFAQSSLDRIDIMKKNALGIGTNTAENYSQQGVRQPLNEKGGKLLSTEA